MLDSQGKSETEILRDLRENKGIHLFRLPTILPTLKSNIYFIEEPFPTLIDAPQEIASNVDALNRALENVGYSIADIQAIIVTHPHLDHFGSAGSISERTGAQVWATTATGAWMKNFERENLEEERFIADSLKLAGVPLEFAADVLRHFRRLTRFGRNAVTSRYLEEGEIIELSSYHVRIVPVPGHTPWCIMLYDQEEGIVFTGDFLLNQISPNPLLQRPAKIKEGYKSLEAYASSLKRAEVMNLKLALPGHGGIIRNPLKRISALLNFINKRKELILMFLRKDHDLTPFDVIRKLFPGLAKEQMFLAVSEVLAYLDVLENEGIVRRIEGVPVRFTIL